MPHRTHEGPSLDKPPVEIQAEHVDLMDILSRITVQRPNIGELSQLIGVALGHAYTRGFEAGQKLAAENHVRRKEANDE